MSHLVSGIASAIFGSPKSSPVANGNYTPPSFSTPGFSGGMNKGAYTLAPSTGLNGAMTGLGTAYGGLSSSLNALLPQIQAGFGNVTKAAQGAYNVATQNLNLQRQQAISNLQQNLAQRGMSGSSFANNALNTTNSTYDQTANTLAANQATTLAGTAMQELDAQHSILTQANQANIDAATSQLNELNLEGSTGAQLAQGMNAVNAQNSQLQAQLLALNGSQGASLLGTFLGSKTGSSLLSGIGGGLSTLGGGIMSLFGGAGAGAAAGAGTDAGIASMAAFA